MSFIKYPSTGQFKDVIKIIQQSAKHHQVPLPVVEFEGSVKLHGTNAGIVVDSAGNWHCQSRERIITPGDDNAGFAAWVHGNKDYWDKVLKGLSGSLITEEEKTQKIQIYGEWCGGNIQSGVGISKLPKMFVIFAMRFSEDAEGNDWSKPKYWEDVFDVEGRPSNLYLKHNFPMYSVTVDFESPMLSQNDLVDLTLKVESECPVAKQLLPEDTENLIGEGLVWEVKYLGKFVDSPLFNTLRSLRFKTKGEKHSTSKVKVIVPVDAEKVKSIDAFVEYACTENRLNQGLSKLQEMGLELVVKNTGEFIKWIMQDILKEELDTLIASGIEPRDINSIVARKAREFYMKNI